MKVLIAFVLLVGGVFLVIKHLKMNKEIKKYEFENRTSGGVVQFKTYEDSVRHKRKEDYGTACLIIGFPMTFFSFIYLLIVLL